MRPLIDAIIDAKSFAVALAADRAFDRALSGEPCPVCGSGPADAYQRHAVSSCPARLHKAGVEKIEYSEAPPDEANLPWQIPVARRFLRAWRAGAWQIGDRQDILPDGF